MICIAFVSLKYLWDLQKRMKTESVPHPKWLRTYMFTHRVVSWTVEQSSCISSVTICWLPTPRLGDWGRIFECFCLTLRQANVGEEKCSLHLIFTFYLNSLRPRQNRRHLADNVFKCNFLNENVWIPIKLSLKFVPKGPINNIPALVQIMAWRQTGDKPLSEPMITQLNGAYMRHSASMS